MIKSMLQPFEQVVVQNRCLRVFSITTISRQHWIKNRSVENVWRNLNDMKHMTLFAEKFGKC